MVRTAIVTALLLAVMVAISLADTVKPVVVYETRIIPPPEYVVLCDGEILRGPEDCERLGLPVEDYFSETVVEAAVLLQYDRFDVYIEATYYAGNQSDLDDFFDKFEPRFNTLESLTKWSSEEFGFGKLRIDVYSSSAGCYGGGGEPGHVNLFLSDPMYSGTCKRFYYELGVPYLGNPGELGDFWPYVEYAIHEATHAICPVAIFRRGWLAEGFARYMEFNILVTNGDINQETADTYTLNGSNYYNWTDYVYDDYHDTSPNQNEIQNSLGYYIVAWMFSMLRDNYSLDWNLFFTIMSTNYETLDKAYELGVGTNGNDISSRYTDMVVIDMFGRALGMSFAEIQAVFRYDGPSGPGWGVRDWVPIDWYADLTSAISFSWEYPVPGETIDIVATVYNNGDTDANDFPVRVYEGTTLLDEQTVSVVAGGSAVITVPYLGTEGVRAFSVYADEDNIKMETDENNNEATAEIICGPCTDSDGDGYGDPGYPADTCPEDNCPLASNPSQGCCCGRVGDANGQGGDEPTIGDASVMIDAKFITGTCDGILDCLTEADLNQSGGADPDCSHITIGDISYLIDYLFITGSSLGLSDCL